MVRLFLPTLAPAGRLVPITSAAGAPFFAAGQPRMAPFGSVASNLSEPAAAGVPIS